MGGGGGGGPSVSPDKLKKLEEIAKQSLKEGDKPSKCNIFISFAHEDLDHINLLRGQAKNENSDIEFNDRSLHEPFNSKKAEYIKRGIRERIKQCSVTVVYISKITHNSKWVNWEIEESLKQGKGVVAMYQGKIPPAQLPKPIKDNNISLVPWNQKQLTKAIISEAENRQKD